LTDRGLLDGTLNGMASLGRGSAAVLGRMQTGSLHLYAWFVLVGIVGALAWSWRHV
jgi:NADH-quinone oxidoreductase subunit L